MRNAILIATWVFLLSFSGSAQVTLTQSDYPISLIGTDSLKITTYTSAFPSLSVATTGLWDMSAVTDSIPLFFAIRVAAVLSYQFADSNTYNFGIFGYDGIVQSSITGSGIFDYGLIIEKAEYSLTFITFKSTDSLIIDSQFVTYSSPHTKIAFPATYNSVWSSTSSADINYRLSLSSFSYDHAPGILRRYTTQKDSVIGWGKMRVKDANGAPSDYLNVLQVQTIITSTDSFFINSAPCSDLMLVKLALTQGNTITTYQQNYYRPREVTALAQVTFTDATYSQPQRAVTHVQRLQAVNVPRVVNGSGIEVYPNPVPGNNIVVDLPFLSGSDCTYELINTLGKVVKEGLIPSNNHKAQISLDAAILPGTYYLKLISGGSLIYSKPIDIIR